MDKERKNSSPDGNGTVPDVAGPTAGEIPAPASERPDAAPDGDAAVRRREIARKALKWTLYAVWFGLFLYLTVCHEEFRDEAQSWMFAKHNSLLGMMKNCWEEGHPWLWHLLLKPFASLGFPYAWAKYIGFALTAAAMAVYCRRSPFPPAVTAATMFLEYSYYCTFARSYSLMLLTMMLAAASWKTRKTRPWATALCIGLMFSTHLIAWVPAYILGIMFFGGLVRERRPVLLPLACTLVPVAIFCLPLYPQIGSTLGKVGIPVAAAVAAGLAATAALLAAAVFFPAFAAKLRRDDADALTGAVLYSIPIVGALGTYVLLRTATGSTIAAETNLLHLSEVVPAVICMAWAVCESGGERSSRGESAFGRAGRTCLGLALVLVWLVGMSSQGLHKKILSDTVKYYSGGPATAEYINENLPEDAVIIATRRGTDTAVGAGLTGGRRLLKLGSHEPLYYTEWCTDWPRFGEKECRDDIEALLAEHGTVYVLYSDDTETERLGTWLRIQTSKGRAETVFCSDDYGVENYGEKNRIPVEHVERYWLYRLTG